MSISSSPQPSPPPLHRSRSGHPHHHLNTPPSSPSRVAAIQASESFDKEGLVAAHWAALHDAHVLEKGLHPIDGPLPPLPSPSLPSKNLKPILIKDLKLGKVHRGRALNGTLCTDSLKVHSVLNVLEDETGLATKLCICNAVPVNHRMLLAQRLYPKASKIAVLEPYHAEFSDGTIGILVEKPSDILFLWVPEIADEDLNKLQVPTFADKTLNDLQRTGESEAKATSVGSSLPASSGQSGIESRSANSEPKLDPLILENASEDSLGKRVEQLGIDAPSSGVSQILNSVDAEKTGAEAFAGKKLPLPLMKPIEPDFERSKDALDGLEVKPSLSDGVGQVYELPPVEEQPEIEHLVKIEACKEAEPASKLQDSTNPARILDREKNADGMHPITGTESPREISPSFVFNSDKLLKTVISGEEESNPEIQPIIEVKSPSQNETEHSDKLLETIISCNEDSKPEMQPITEVKSPSQNETEHSDKLLETIISCEEESKPEMQLIREVKSPCQNETEHSEKLLETISSAEEESKPEIQPITEVKSPPQNETERHSEDSLSNLESHSVNDEVNVSLDAKQATFHKPDTESNGRVKDFLTDEDPLKHLDAKSLRIRGNRLFTDANWKAAADMYTQAIRKAEREHQSQDTVVYLDEDEILLGYSNRSEACLRQREFEKAKADAKKALLRNPNHAKSLFRLGRAFVGLGKGTEALPLFEAAMKLAPNDKDLKVALEQCSRIPRPKPKSRKKHAVPMS